jgi:hypothetical protein
MEALDASCGKCGGGHEVTFCAAWAEYLCVMCRANRNAAELGPILKVAVWEPPVYPSQVALDAAYLEAVEAAEARP